jgi:hypothetical protein
LALKNHAVARLFPFVSWATIKIWRKTPAFATMMQRLKHLIFFTLLDSARACEIRLDKNLSLSRLFHFDTQRLQGTVLPGEKGLPVLVFETSQHSCGDE